MALSTPYTVIISCSAVALLLVGIILLFIFLRYKKQNKLKCEKERLYEEFYVNLLPRKQRENRRRKTSSNGGKRSLCRGLVGVVDQAEQEPVEWVEPLKLLDRDRDGRKQSAPEPSMPSSDLTERLLMSSGHDNNNSLSKLKSKGYLNSMTNLLSNVGKKTSNSNLSSSSGRPRLGKTQKISSHSLTTQQSFSTALEAMTSSLTQPITDCKEPEIVLSILYNEATGSLTVTVLCITNINQKLTEPQNIYLQACLRPNNHPRQTSQDVFSTDAEFNECFYFDKVRNNELPTSHLTLTVNKSSNDRKVAELFINIASMHLVYGVASHFKLPLVTCARSRKKSTLEKLLQVELGQIQVLLHYQPIPNRLKVLVNKANQLPKSDAALFKPEFQVVIELFSERDHQLLESKSTSFQTGENPIWNEVFLFSFVSANIDDHYLDLTVVERRRYKANNDVIGHVLLGGSGTSAQAVVQWADCSQPYKVEKAHWHSVLPVIKYNVELDLPPGSTAINPNYTMEDLGDE